MRQWLISVSQTSHTSAVETNAVLKCQNANNLFHDVASTVAFKVQFSRRRGNLYKKQTHCILSQSVYSTRTRGSWPCGRLIPFLKTHRLSWESGHSLSICTIVAMVLLTNDRSEKWRPFFLFSCFQNLNICLQRLCLGIFINQLFSFYKGKPQTLFMRKLALHLFVWVRFFLKKWQWAFLIWLKNKTKSISLNWVFSPKAVENYDSNPYHSLWASGEFI